MSYATPFQTVIGNALDLWILGSVARNRNRSHIHLLPFLIVSKERPLPRARCSKQGSKGPRTKFQGSKETRGSEVQGLLAGQHEHEAEVGAPDVVGIAVAPAQPQPAADVPDAEDVAVAARVGDGFHSDTEPFVAGLVLVLQAQLGTDFRRAELEAELDGLGADLRVGRVALEAQLLDGADDEIDFGLFGGQRERGLAEQIVGVVAHLALGGLESRLERLQVLVGPEGDRLPDGVGRRDCGAHEEFAAQEAQSAFFATELLDDCVHLTEGQVFRSKCHCVLHWATVPVGWFPLIRGGARL